MKLKNFLKQFEGLDPETEVFKREGFKDDPPRKDFSKSFHVFSYKADEKANIEKVKSILV